MSGSTELGEQCEHGSLEGELGKNSGSWWKAVEPGAWRGLILCWGVGGNSTGDLLL